MNRDSQRPTRPPPPGSEDDELDRPTVVPEFDLAEFARKKMLGAEAPAAIPGNAPVLSSESTDLAELFGTGDLEATLAVCEALLQQDPNDADAKKYAELSRRELSIQYLAALGGSTSVIPRRASAADAADDPFADVLSEVDGDRSIDEIVHATQKDRLTILAALYDLLRRGAIDVP